MFLSRALPLSLSLALPALAAARDYVPPPGAGYVDVQRDGGAKGDGRTDDTRALKAIIEAGKHHPHPEFGSARLIYFPNGVYLVGEPIVVGDKKKALIGQSREGVVLKLRDRAPSFQNAAKPTPLLNVRGKRHFAQNFAQRIHNLTIDVGAGNPGAAGVEYHTNNSGDMFNVLIKTSDPQRRGAVGLSMVTGSGPGLIHKVGIEGFEVGVLYTGSLHSMAFDRIELRGQRRVGFEVRGNTASISRLASRNRVTALRNAGGHVVLVEAQLVGGAGDATAVVNEKGGFFCRDVRTEGYGAAIRSGEHTVEGPGVAEFAWPRVHRLFDGPARSLGLPIEDPPVPSHPEPDQWTVVEPEGPKADLTAPLQRAIDAGAEYVFVSAAKFGYLRDTIRVRGRVRVIAGAPTRYRSQGFTHDELRSYKPLVVDRAPDKRPVWRIEDGEPEVVMLKLLGDSYGDAGWGVEHASARTLVLWGAGGHYRNTVTGGKVFFIDAGPSPGSVLQGPQKAWAWQTNTESYTHNPHILNRGATLWILGIKTEKDRTILTTTAGGASEVLGGLLYKNRQRIGQAPAFVNRQSRMACSYRVTGKRYDVHVLEERDGQRRTLRASQTYGRRVPLYVGGPAAATRKDSPE
ncbi:MAG: glycosyl hydrolase family 28-related protein [Candidatus Brocadiia bacterium]